MAEQKLRISKIVLPVTITVCLIISAVCAYFGRIDTTWTTAPNNLMYIQVVAVIFLAAAFFLSVGAYARSVGYTTDELNKWGDDALSGKPPI